MTPFGDRYRDQPVSRQPETGLRTWIVADHHIVIRAVNVICSECAKSWNLQQFATLMYAKVPS